MLCAVMLFDLLWVYCSQQHTNKFKPSSYIEILIGVGCTK